MREGPPKIPASADPKPIHEAISPKDIEPILNELEGRVADIEPKVDSNTESGLESVEGENWLKPKEAEDLNETLRGIGAK